MTEPSSEGALESVRVGVAIFLDERIVSKIAAAPRIVPGPEPGGSVRGERASFTRLVLGWLAGG